MIRRLGKIGLINKKARQEIARISEEKQIYFCELQLIPECMNEAHAPAHRHPRVWYRSSPELLCDYKQWVGACQACHSYLDHKLSMEETEEIFLRIRGPE